MTRFTDVVQFAGKVSMLADVVFSQPVVDNAAVETSAEISANKTINRQAINYVQDDGTPVVTATTFVHLCRSAGTIKSVEVRPMTAPTGGDLQYTVDVKKAIDGSGSFTTVLSAVVTVDNASVDETRQQAGLIATPATVDGDMLQIIITVSGSTGVQGDGVIVTINIDESGL
jgi:hypothetical protein